MHKGAPSKKAAGATTYQRRRRRLTYTAAQAKRDHSKGPMDGGAPVSVTHK